MVGVRSLRGAGATPSLRARVRWFRSSTSHGGMWQHPIHEVGAGLTHSASQARRAEPSVFAREIRRGGESRRYSRLRLLHQAERWSDENRRAERRPAPGRRTDSEAGTGVFGGECRAGWEGEWSRPAARGTRP